MDKLFSFLAESFDLPILDWIADHMACPLLDRLMPLITALANGGILWIGVALVLLVTAKHRKTGIQLAAALLLGLVVCNLGMKPLFARIRPFDYQLEHFGKTVRLLIAAPHDYSFPSGHTIASFEAAAVLLANSKRLGIPALILAILIAFSRLYLYVHYPTDVLVSGALGTAIGLFACWAVNKIQFKRLSH